MAIPSGPIATHLSFLFLQQAGPRSAGWSMNFWNDSVNLNTALDKGAVLAPILQKCVGKQAILGWMSARLAYQPGVRGQRVVASKYLIKPGGAPNLKAEDADYPTTALLMELRTAAGDSIRQTIRSLPDDATTVGGWYTPQGDTPANITALLTELGRPGSGWCLLTQDASKTPKPVQFFDTASSTVSCAAHGYDTGDVVKIGGRKIGVTPRLNGIWKISGVFDANHFQLQGYKTSDEAQEGHFTSTFVQQHVMSVKTLIFAPDKNITSQVTFMTKRDVGRPRKVLTGRRMRPA